MTVAEFCAAYPQYAFDFDRWMYEQPRIWHPPETLPVELAPSYPFVPGGGRSRPSLNQTLTHHQCKICRRVLRNDQYWQTPSLNSQNIGHTYCLECGAKKGVESYARRAPWLKRLRDKTWQYIAPKCATCGYDKHHAALDMHHIYGRKDNLVGVLITNFAQAPSTANAEQLVTEAAKCVALCANCHRLVHAGVVTIPDNLQRLQYTVADLMDLARYMQTAQMAERQRRSRDDGAVGVG